MSDEVLFTVTPDNLETGLRGYPIGYCVTSKVDPLKGLFYANYPVSELDSWIPEKVIFLLLNGRVPQGNELESFTQDLRARAKLAPEVYSYIEALPRKSKPMALLTSALLIAGAYECKEDYKEDCLNLIAKIPLIVAATINHHAGWGKTPPSKPELGYMENFAQMLKIPNKTTKELPEAFRLVNVLHYDHGGGNLSAFTGKAVASGFADLYASIGASMLALGGPRHGGACEEALKMINEVIDNVGEDLKPEAVKNFIVKKLAGKGVIFGFGHAVLRVEDPRATVLYEFGKKHFPNNVLVRAALLLREIVPEVLKTQPKIQDPYANVDAVTGSILSAAGFSYPPYFPLIFGLARTVGISIQIVYERLEARGGKGTPIIRPKYIYKERKNA